MDGDVWDRLKRLDHCCDIHISNSEPGRWTASVGTRGETPELFEVSGVTLRETVELLVAEAERRQWPSAET